jgi:L-fucose isomerase-like protein
MTHNSVVAVIPIGELDSDPTRRAYESILRVFNNDPVSNETEVSLSVSKLLAKTPDLLVIIPFRGLSAQIIEKAGMICQVPCLVWPIQGNFSLPSSTLAIGALKASGVPTTLFYTPPDDPDTIEKLNANIRAATAFSRLHRSRIGVIGKLFPNLVSCRYDPQIISSRLGTIVIPIDFQEIRDSLQVGRYNISEVERLHQEIVKSYDCNPDDIRFLDAGIRLHLTLKQIAQTQKIDGFAAECWSGFPKELGLNPCLGFIEDEYSLACEGDVMLCISLLIVRYLTAASAYNGDLFDLDMDGNLTLVHCGAPASLATNKNEVVLSHSQLARERGFVTLSCRPKLNKGIVTIFRFYGLNCDYLHVASGVLLECEQSPGLKVKIKLSGDRSDFLEQCFGNHYVVVEGDIRKEIILLCKWLGITIFET